MKCSRLGDADKDLRVTPEHDDLKRIAAEHDIPLGEARLLAAKFIKEGGLS
jgi:uncharacterized protein (DUF111 family)